MLSFNIGSILSVSAPDGAVCKNDAIQNCVQIFADPDEGEMQLFLFESLGKGGAAWSYDELTMHIEKSVGPPFQTSVQRVESESWVGYQGVTALSDIHFLVNRVIASKVSDYGARIEFRAAKNALPESLMEIVESIVFINSDTL